MSRAEWDAQAIEHGGTTIQDWIDMVKPGLAPNIDSRALPAFKAACPPETWKTYRDAHREVMAERQGLLPVLNETRRG
jgi:hypothetical protein